VAVRARIAKQSRLSRSRGLRTFVLVVAITSVPVLGTLLAIVSTTEPDLSELSPIRQFQGQYGLLKWYALRQGDFSPAGSIQALGYMLEGNRPLHTGDSIRDFVLLPEAGNILHPAHRIPNQLIAVHLREGGEIQFSPRSLVWVWGTSARGLEVQPSFSLFIISIRRRPNARTNLKFPSTSAEQAAYQFRSCRTFRACRLLAMNS
jgi:hypothetical protein